jgi:glycosyltransferase involved in cell wall biosynthesis
MATLEECLVSVIIPCYNQAHFLSEAIDSVLTQTYPHFEIIVVDDGSTDNTFEVAARYPEVHCIRQGNQGLSAARNTGFGKSKGSYLVFLDADDRFLPNALDAGLECLNSHPECAFVYGHVKFIASDGSPLPTPKQVCIEKDHCLELLLSGYIHTSGVVMYRRTVFGAVGGFDTRLEACEDCDFEIRIARDFPTYCHGKVILEYRQHSASMSRNSALMLKNALAAHRSQLKYVKGNERLEAASKIGKRAGQDYYGRYLINEVWAHVASRDFKQAIQGILVLLRYHPRGFIKHACQELPRVFFRARKELLRGITRRTLPAPIYHWLRNQWRGET